MQVQFAVNAQAKTQTPHFVAALRPHSWLIPYGSPKPVLERLGAVAPKSTNSIWLADNNALELIKTARRVFVDGTNAADAKDKMSRVRSILKNRRFVVNEAKGMPPGFVCIGAEDLTLGLCDAVGLTPEVIPDVHKVLERMNTSVLRTATHDTYTVIAAMDRPSAAAAFAAAQDGGLHRICIGFDLYSGSNRFVSPGSYGFKSAAQDRLPERYIGIGSQLLGLRDAGSHSSQMIHFLGLGTPILMALAIAACRDAASISFDATTPLQDAAQGIIYDPNSWAKARRLALVQQMIQGKRPSWSCPCPFCDDYNVTHPFSLEHLLRFARGLDRISRHDLDEGGALFPYAGIFGRPAAPEQRRFASQAVMGHNHWLLQKLCETLEVAPARRVSLIASMVKTYTSVADSNYAEAVGLIWTDMRPKTSGPSGDPQDAAFRPPPRAESVPEPEAAPGASEATKPGALQHDLFHTVPANRAAFLT